MKTMMKIAIATALIVGTVYAGTPPGCWPCRSERPIVKGKPVVKKAVK